MAGHSITFDFSTMTDAEIATLQASNADRIGPERPAAVSLAWRHYAVSYGNGNDGLSRLYPNFTLWCHPDAIEDVARAAIITTGRASRKFLRDGMTVDEAGEDAVQAAVYNPPRSPDWCEHNGAWMLCDVYPIDEASDRSEAPEYASPVAAFGRCAPALAAQSYI